MKRESVERSTYKPNDGVSVTVVNKPVVSKATGKAIGYDRTVTIKVKAGLEDERLEFASGDDIATFIGNIDVDDNQQTLFEVTR